MNKKSYNYKNEFVHLLMFFKNNFLTHKFLFNLNIKKSSSFDFSTFLRSLVNIFFWAKVRILYFTNNWIYTTNHKRIAVNYFWFVILSGIVGMVLATLIRLEFAYPGVGIFAGDSLQYLSMATAHGVIMVFFMIMPLLFGAFANFLIPTQLGVHDVAFPRLNSAAFWFLPGGLLMLCQLVCVDRRYQRMNCFNIREIQSILKRKFFTDLINTHEHHTLLDKTAMGLRFKTNNINSINSNIFVFYNYGIEFAPKIRSNYFFSNEFNFQNISFFNNFSYFYSLITKFLNFNLFFFFNNFYLFLGNQFSLVTSLNLSFKNFSLFFFSSILYFYYNFFSLINNIFESFYSFSMIYSILFKNFSHILSFFFYFFSPIYVFYFIFDIIYNFVYNFFNFYLFFSLNFSLFFNNFKFNQYFFLNLWYDFFFFIKFFEIIYFFNTNFFHISYLLNNFYLLSQTVNSLFYDFINLFSSFYELPQYLNLTTSYKNSFANINFEIKNEENLNHLNKKSLLTNSYFFFNYDSYLIYFYTILFSLYNLPFILLNIFKNIFNSFNLISLFFYYYDVLVSWYLPSLLNDNIFYLIYRSFNFNSLNFTPINSFFFYNNLKFFFYNVYSINFTNFSLISFYHYSFNFFFSFFFDFFYSFFSFFSFFFSNLSYIFFSNYTFSSFVLFYNIYFNLYFNNFLISQNNSSSLYYKSNHFSNTSLSLLNKYTNEENSETFRYLKFYNPVFKYDFKSGDYFPKLYKEAYSYLFLSMSEAVGSLRSAPWFLSPKYFEYFNANFLNFFENVSNSKQFSSVILHSWSTSRFNNTDGFYNFFYVLANDNIILNKKWISLNTLNQKFYRMFNTSSMQQRIYSNWRQLKFTREAWRCKLLAARHQKTLFRRYSHEDGVFWSIERNAKDLLPGWAMITPFSARTRFTAVGKTDIGLMGVFLVLNSSIISGANFLVTYRYLSTLNNRKMRDARVFFTESIIVACWMMIFANPMLAIAILMLLSDRHWQTSFFDYSGGGDTVLFQHMFWFFGHPEVYVIIIPTFGFTNSMISYYLRKRVSARASLLYSMYTIAFLGFFVWGHHMYMVGLSHTTRMLFSTLTVMISVPAATKIMHWCVTTVNSSIAMELPLLFTFTFIFLFVSGGISGMCVAHTGMDILFHDTFYVIGHFHVMLAGGAMFGSFGAFYFYFPAIFGVKYSRIYAYLHYSYYLLGQLLTVIPMFWLGYAGMPRRVLDYPASMGGWHSVISAGHMLSVAGLIAFFIMIFDSLRQGKAVIRNTFGISRYNTRLNFYLYEISRLTYIQQKGLTFFRFVKPTSVKLNNLNYLNFEPFETTLISYTFYQK